MGRIAKNEKGQVMIMVAVVLTVLLGFTALTVDGGRGYVTQSKLQNAADAAALAGAQKLPSNPSQAIVEAQNLLTANGIDLSSDDVTFSVEDDDHSLKVTVKRNMPTYFARIWGKDSSIVSADATGTAGYAASVPWIVPFVIPQPLEFNYDNPYVMRMYGGGPYPAEHDNTTAKSGKYKEGQPYCYPDDYTSHPVYGDYPLEGDANVYTTNTTVTLKKEPSNSTQNPGNISPTVTIPANKEVTYNYYKRVGRSNPQTWFNITYGGKTGWAKKQYFDMNKEVGNIYPYHFDYMNVYIKKESGTDQYYEWLENGYHDKFSVGETMYYMDPSSGGKTAWNAFGERVSRDHNTDRTKAEVGDGRVILIPIVERLLSRNTADKTPMTVKGFVAFYIQSVHKNYYGTTAWFDGWFLEDVKIDTDDFTFDPDADFGLRVVKLTE